MINYIALCSVCQKNKHGVTFKVLFSNKKLSVLVCKHNKIFEYPDKK